MQTCVGCGTTAPETQTDYTLISAQFGWRLARVKLGDGSMHLQWRCPACWREYKRVRGSATPEGEAESAPAPHLPTPSLVPAAIAGGARTGRSSAGAVDSTAVPKTAVSEAGALKRRGKAGP